MGFRDFVCGDPDHDDDEDEDGFEMISRLIIIILLIVILVVLLIVLYVQFRIIRQVNKNAQSAPRINLSSNLVDNYHGPSDDQGSVDNIEKKLAVPSATTARPSSGHNPHPQTRFLKQPQNLPAPPVFHNIRKDVNKPESVKKQRPEISGVNPANFGFYTSSVPGGPMTYPQNEGQVNFGFYGKGNPGGAPAPKYSGVTSESGISSESRSDTPDSFMPDVEGAERDLLTTSNTHQF